MPKALVACVALACLLWAAAAQGVDDATAAPPTIRFEYAFYAVPADFPYLWVSAYRVGNLKGRATAAWTTADSSASNGVDYRQSTGELAWADGVGGAQQLYVPLIPRRTGPYDRTFTVLLHDQTGAALSFPSAAVVTISQPSVWQLWADASTGGTGTGTGAGVDPFGVPNGSTGSAVTNTPSPSDGAGAGTVNPTSTPPTTNPTGGNPTTPTTGSGTPPVIGGSSGTDPTNTGGSGTGATTTPSGGTGPQTNPGSGSGTPIGGSGSGTDTGSGGNVIPSSGSGSDSGSGSGTGGSGSQPTTGGGGNGGQPSGGGSTTTPVGSGSVQPTGGSGTPTTPASTTGGSQQQSGGSGGSATSASTGILTQFASAFTWDSAAYQTDNSNNFVVVGVSRLQVLPLGLQPCSVRYTTVDGTGRAGVDYTATSGVLEYGANDFAPRAIFVPIRQGDASSSPSGVKVFAIRLTDPVNAFLGVPSSAPISVSAVPFSEGKVVLTSDAYATPVQAGRAVATVQRLMGSAGAVNVSYSTTDGTAKAGTDYTATSGTLSWADGDSAPRNISIPLLASAAASALPSNGTVAGAPNFFLSLALDADSKGFLGGPRTAAMFITNLAHTTTQTSVGTGTSTGNGGTGIGTGTGTGTGIGTGTGSGVKPTASSSTGTNKPPTASSTGTRVPPVVVPPPSTTGTASPGTGTTTNTTSTDRSAAASVRGIAPAALATVLLSALWLAA